LLLLRLLLGLACVWILFDYFLYGLLFSFTCWLLPLLTRLHRTPFSINHILFSLIRATCRPSPLLIYVLFIIICIFLIILLHHPTAIVLDDDWSGSTRTIIEQTLYLLQLIIDFSLNFSHVFCQWTWIWGDMQSLAFVSWRQKLIIRMAYSTGGRGHHLRWMEVRCSLLRCHLGRFFIASKD